MERNKKMEAIRPNEEINGRYVLKQSKGRGTFGEVWLAYDRATDEDVAIKFYVALDDKGREEFIQEFRIAAKLRHPNLLVTKDYGEWQGHPYLTMKFCDHGSAADLVGTLKPCYADEKTIWRFIRDVAAGLAYLHAVKPDPIVHQDIKPDNTLIDSDGTFLITDFGISKRIRNTMRKQSERALKAGAPAYMAPERFSAHSEPILASDVWSLGASIYELAQGELPFCGMGGGMLLKGAEMPSLDEGWSANLNTVIHWCLEKETWNRAKASQVQMVAEYVLKYNNAPIASLIAKLKKGEPLDPPEPQKDGQDKFDPHATNRQVETDSSDSSGDEVLGENGEAAASSSVSQKWKLLYPGIAVIVLSLAVIALAVVAIWFFSSHNANTVTPVDIDSIAVADTIAVVDTFISEEVSNEKPITSKNKENKKNEKPTPRDERLSLIEKKTMNGTLDLGYAKWNGEYIGGKPDGEGTMTFIANHRIDTRDPNRRMAEAGDRVVGTYSNGHLVDGRWYKSDGSTEYIMLGE